tara:strand:+ start:29677 stop:30318 length:642 start_codon:yes stop_codon:yes gene_type:complete
MSNIKIEEAKRILKLAIIQKNEIKIEGLVVELKINKEKIQFLYKEESVDTNQESYVIEFDYDDSSYKLKSKITNNNIEVLEVLSKEENNNRLIKVEDYGLLLIDKKTELSINIIKISRSLLFFKILKKDEDTVFNNLDSKLNLIINYNKKKIKLEVNPKIESVSKTEDTLIYSEIEIKEESKEIFEEYIKEKTYIQNKKEKSILINNLIKENY